MYDMFSEKFLLTHPVWDVTEIIMMGNRFYIISTHTSRVGCDGRENNRMKPVSISTHTSRVGCDTQRIKAF